MTYDVILSLLVLIEKLGFSTNSFQGLLHPQCRSNIEFGQPELI